MFNITRQAQLDNLYKQKFPMIAKSFKRSFLIAKETLGAAVLNNGFTTQLTGDGQPLFSTAHIIDTGTVANRPTTGSDMNETSWESGLIQVAFFKDIAGNPTQAKVVKLIVPPQLEYVACRLTKSAFRTNTPNNDISATYHIGSAPEGYRVNHYLSSGSAWFMLTDSPNGFKMYQREPFQTDTYVDFLTDNIQCKGLERYSFGVTNWRAGWGNPGQ